MNKTVYITGHKNPDTDSIAASISYSYYKSITDKTYKYVPVRLGKLSSETKYVLEYFNVSEPEYLDTIDVKIEDICNPNFVSVSNTETVGNVYEKFEDKDVKTIVVLENGKLCGVITPSRLDKIYHGAFSKDILHKSNTPFQNVVSTLNASVLTEFLDVELSGKLSIAAMGFDDVDKYFSHRDIAIVGNREDVIKKLIDKKVSLIIVTCDSYISDEVIEYANSNKVAIIKTHLDTFDSARKICLSVPIKYILNSSNLTTFNKDDLVIDCKKLSKDNRYRSFPVIDENMLPLGLVRRDDLFSSNKKKVILVDHNEISQTVDGIKSAEVLELIDHHKIGSLTSSNPMHVRCEVVGSTCTIVASMFLEDNITIPKEIAGIMLSAIISDTLLFKSPTTTKKDTEVAYKLAEIAGIEDLNLYGIEMLKVGASLSGKTISEIFYSDFKEFQIETYKTGIGQVMTMDFDSFNDYKDELINYMEELANRENYDFLLLLLTNVVTESSLFICVGKAIDKVENAFDITFEDNVCEKANIVSRKKQVVPALMKALTSN